MASCTLYIMLPAPASKPLPRRQKTRRRLWLCMVVAGLVGYIGFTQRADTSVPVAIQPHVEAKAPAPKLSAKPEWPQNVTAAAIGAVGYGVIAAHGSQQPRPIASIAKVITALSLLEKYPLKPGESGPSIPITAEDEQRYRDYIAQNGSVVPVKIGVSISLHDALEAMMLPSANNVADTTAVWAFGSLQNYTNFANTMLQRKGLRHTTIAGDASGLNPGTTSTPADLIALAELALQNPVLAAIAGQASAVVPFAGTVPNYNRLVTQYSYTGIKPGDSNEAGVTLLFSDKHTFNGKEIHLTGVILGGDGSYRQETALQLMESAKATLSTQ